jgi:hypothetical protein
MTHDREAEKRAAYEEYVRGMAEDARMTREWEQREELIAALRELDAYAAQHIGGLVWRYRDQAIAKKVAALLARIDGGAA